MLPLSASKLGVIVYRGYAGSDDESREETTSESNIWSNYLLAADKFDETIIRDWNQSMDVRLFSKAGLFSAVQTAFLIEAYKNLGDDPAQRTVSLLREIDQHIQERAPGSGRANSNLASLNSGNFTPSSSAVRVNCAWFASLILTLGIPVIIVLVKQWLDKYNHSKASESDRERARLRQYRYTGLQQWKVPEIIGLLPI
ncbi:hypothetical protein BOTBODRAFT_118970, partial [Botryobasidium botryosum FD-172 SS1]